VPAALQGAARHHPWKASTAKVLEEAYCRENSQGHAFPFQQQRPNKSTEASAEDQNWSKSLSWQNPAYFSCRSYRVEHNKDISQAIRRSFRGKNKPHRTGIFFLTEDILV